MQNLYKKKIASLISFFTLNKKLGDRILTYHSINNKKNSTTSNIYQLEKDLFYNQVKLLITCCGNRTQSKRLQFNILFAHGCQISKLEAVLENDSNSNIIIK